METHYLLGGQQNLSIMRIDEMGALLWMYYKRPRNHDDCLAGSDSNHGSTSRSLIE
jgi:hypothetical protein